MVMFHERSERRHPAQDVRSCENLVDDAPEPVQIFLGFFRHAIFHADIADEQSGQHSHDRAGNIKRNRQLVSAQGQLERKQDLQLIVVEAAHGPGYEPLKHASKQRTAEHTGEDNQKCADLKRVH